MRLKLVSDGFPTLLQVELENRGYEAGVYVVNRDQLAVIGAAPEMRLSVVVTEKCVGGTPMWVWGWEEQHQAPADLGGAELAEMLVAAAQVDDQAENGGPNFQIVGLTDLEFGLGEGRVVFARNVHGDYVIRKMLDAYLNGWRDLRAVREVF